MVHDNADNRIAVVGGGVAGAATCVALAHQGLSVDWVAPARGSPPRAGDTLPAVGGQCLTRWHARHLLDSPAHRPAPNSFSAWGNAALIERRHDTTPAGVGWLIDRAVFDRDLAQLATANCRVRRHEQRVHDVIADGNSWGLSLANGAILRSPLIIDATGRSCRLARRWQRLHRHDRLLATRWLLRSTDSSCLPTPTQLVEAEPNGWWFAGLLADDTLSVTFYSDPEERSVVFDLAHAQLPGSVRTRWLQRWLDDANFAAVGPPHRCSAATQWLTAPAGWHADALPWAAVGDAAFACDPLAAHGLTHAFWGAEQVAAAAERALLGQANAFATYIDHSTRGREQHLQTWREQYRAERRFAHTPFWQRRATFGEAGAAC